MNHRWTVLWLVFAATLFIEAKIHSSKMRVCVIGAGPAGIFSIKQLIDNIEDFEPIVFERSSDVGGQWIYTDSTDVDEHGLPVYSSIYKYLRTNTPKELMECLDYAKIGGENRSSMKHETVLEYLRNYTDHFNLRPYIQLNTLVEKVTPILGNGDWRTTKWRVKIRNLKTNLSDHTICDSVIISSGSFSNTSVPKIPGIESFPGRVLHSHVYRKPEEFINQTVVVLGAGFSGKDIAFELSQYATTVYLSHRHVKIATEMPSNIVQVAGVIAANGSKLILQDNSTITADAFIFCTGYIGGVPFLDSSSGLQFNKSLKFYLYRQIININHKSMGFVGLMPGLSSWCTKYQLQAKYYLSFLQGKIRLPSRDEMFVNAVETLPNKTLTVDERWSYMDELSKDTGFEFVPNYVRQIDELWLASYHKNPYRFKEYNVQILKDGSIRLIHYLETNKYICTY